MPLPRARAKATLVLLETPLGRVVAKRSLARGWKRPLTALGARAGRPERAFDLGEALRACGLATPEPLAVLGGRADGVLVTRYVEGLGPWELLRAGGALAGMLELLAAALARLHAAGFSHRDLKASNVLLANDASEVVWTDLDALRRVGTLGPRARARDLARLAASFESAEARAAGIRAQHWPALARRYLEHALLREPRSEEYELLLARTRRYCVRTVRRHLGRATAVH
jgi:tRNA A-37 threonylcarbamoyl transferase component Bud32